MWWPLRIFIPLLIIYVCVNGFSVIRCRMRGVWDKLKGKENKYPWE